MNTAEQITATKDKIKSNNPYPELTVEQKLQEWSEVEELVLRYQKQFQEDYENDENVKIDAMKAAEELIHRFHPLFKKYCLIIKSGTFNWDDTESKDFVSNFINDKFQLKALRSKTHSNEIKKRIYDSFNFIRESYGSQSDEELMTDLKMLFLVLAKRYKQSGRNFCAYVANGYKFEVARHIKKFFKNPINIPYKVCEYNADVFKNSSQETYEDQYYENSTGIPSMEWINGYCGDMFQKLNPIERKILVKYYLENLNDKQIAGELGLHLNTINSKRRKALATLCNEYGIDFKSLKRNRKSGKKAIVSSV